jgi:hypothetical protein
MLQGLSTSNEVLRLPGSSTLWQTFQSCNPTPLFILLIQLESIPAIGQPLTSVYNELYPYLSDKIVIYDLPFNIMKSGTCKEYCNWMDNLVVELQEGKFKGYSTEL